MGLHGASMLQKWYPFFCYVHQLEERLLDMESETSALVLVQFISTCADFGRTLLGFSSCYVK